MDEDSGLVHHVEGTAANLADVTQVQKLLHGGESAVYGDSGYAGAKKRPQLQAVPAGVLIAEKRSKRRAMKNRRAYAEPWERYTASVRAKVEPPFRVVKRQFGHIKVRYRGLAKNAAQMVTLFVCAVASMDGARAFVAGDGSGASVRLTNPPKTACAGDIWLKSDDGSAP